MEAFPLSFHFSGFSAFLGLSVGAGLGFVVWGSDFSFSGRVCLAKCIGFRLLTI